MNFADIWNTSQEDYYNFVPQADIVRFFLLFEQYGVKLLITSFWDTQYLPIWSQRLSGKSNNSVSETRILTIFQMKYASVYDTNI